MEDFTFALFFLVFISSSWLGFDVGKDKGRREVASGKVVCQQALGEWVCKPKDEVKQ